MRLIRLLRKLRWNDCEAIPEEICSISENFLYFSDGQIVNACVHNLSWMHFRSPLRVQDENMKIDFEIMWRFVMAEDQNIEWKESWWDEYLKWVCG